MCGKLPTVKVLFCCVRKMIQKKEEIKLWFDFLCSPASSAAIVMSVKVSIMKEVVLMTGLQFVMKLIDIEIRQHYPEVTLASFICFPLLGSSL